MHSSRHIGTICGMWNVQCMHAFITGIKRIMTTLFRYLNKLVQFSIEKRNNKWAVYLMTNRSPIFSCKSSSNISSDMYRNGSIHSIKILFLWFKPICQHTGGMDRFYSYDFLFCMFLQLLLIVCQFFTSDEMVAALLWYRFADTATSLLPTLISIWYNIHNNQRGCSRYHLDAKFSPISMSYMLFSPNQTPIWHWRTHECRRNHVFVIIIIIIYSEYVAFPFCFSFDYLTNALALSVGRLSVIHSYINIYQRSINFVFFRQKKYE